MMTIQKFPLAITGEEIVVGMPSDATILEVEPFSPMSQLQPIVNIWALVNDVLELEARTFRVFSTDDKIPYELVDPNNADYLGTALLAQGSKEYHVFEVL